MKLIRTTMRPGEVIEVPDADYVDLARQGMVAEVVTPDAPAAPARRGATTTRIEGSGD